MSVKVINVEKMETREVNHSLRQLTGKIKVMNPNSAHFIAAGLCKKLEIEIKGSVGYYLGTCMDGPSVHVGGNAGWFSGDNMTNGTIVIEGLSGDGTGQGIYGGLVVVKSDCGSRTGQLMKNGTVVVGGNSGYMTGLYAFGGRIIVCGDVGDSAGESIIGGALYVGGKIKSLGKNARKEKVTAREQESIKKLLRKYDIKPPQEFTKVTSLKRRVYPVDIGEG
ncbi:tributyrin esterase [candidate division MSBL1 archaeon SCGC-AAA261C02]|uniref:Tributyrin esterase n=1 Tax=candidate division MSBL1 archaeon SCGC-AAA261C02 TaxID=1698272 RepID=A0A133V1J0_9EURY|nr:tributyrin esterase [candidate division MSBL1 archaeon SCGC-AAA261C02]